MILQFMLINPDLMRRGFVIDAGTSWIYRFIAIMPASMMLFRYHRTRDTIIAIVGLEIDSLVAPSCTKEVIFRIKNS